jgi:hypothetical protein
VKIVGIEDLTTDQIHREIANGGKFVFYQYCVSAVLVTFKRTSNIYFLRAGQHSAVHGLPFTLISLVAGWWGIPWGPIYTIQSVWTNITGGRDVTPEILAQQTSSPADPIESTPVESAVSAPLRLNPDVSRREVHTSAKRQRGSLAI